MMPWTYSQDLPCSRALAAASSVFAARSRSAVPGLLGAQVQLAVVHLEGAGVLGGGLGSIVDGLLEGVHGAAGRAVDVVQGLD
jgi:hypothetical protein